MAYGQINGNSPIEYANSTGHIPLINDTLIQRLIEKYKNLSKAPKISMPVEWNRIQIGDTIVKKVIVSDGSYINVYDQKMNLAYIRAGAIELPAVTDGTTLHPYDLNEMYNKKLEYVQTVIPEAIICQDNGLVQKAIRDAIYITFMSYPDLMDTFTFLLLEKWGQKPQKAICHCPKCHKAIEIDKDIVTCKCGEHIYITDMIDWPFSGARMSHFAGSYMLVLETLILFSKIRQKWETNPEELNSILFMHDGPLLLSADYYQLTSKIAKFLKYCHITGREIKLCGVEKSGYFVNHLQALDCDPQNDVLFFVPPRNYIQDYVGLPYMDDNYGEGVFYGHKVFVVVGNSRLVISVPFNSNTDDFEKGNLMQLMEIVSALPQLITHMYKNALYPLIVINHAISIARGPCERILAKYAREFGEPKY